MNISRKEFIKLSGALGLSSVLPVGGYSHSEILEKPNLFKIGLASYSLRKLSIEDTIKACQRLGITHISLKSFHLPLDSSPEEIKSIVGQFTTAGIKVYGVGVVYMKTAEEVNKTFEYAGHAGVEMIVGVPNYELLPLVEQKVKSTGIKLAIHNHGPEDKVYPSVNDVNAQIKDLDHRIGFCIDVGHVYRNGEDPAKMIKKYKARMFDMHMKDITEAILEGKPTEIGRGGMDIKAIVKALKSINYSGVIGFEYEKDADEPLLGLAESIGYVRALV